MKKIAIVIVMFLVLPKLGAQGISFEHNTFKEALAKAKAEKKLLFMDCFTTWCGPCKMMAKEIFPQAQVGEYMNANFVSIKMDMEKGEGIELAKTYSVNAYPTLLFMDSDGKVVHRATGAEKAEDFIQQAKIAFDPTKQLDYLEKQYQSGNRDMAFLAQYVKALYTAYNLEAIAKVGKDVFPTMKPEQYLTEDGFTVIAHAGVDYKSKIYNYLIKNKKAFLEKPYIGKESYDYVIGTAISNYVTEIATKKTLPELDKAIAETQKDYVSPQQDLMNNYYYGQYYLAKKQYDTWFDFNKKKADEAFAKNPKEALSSYINTAYSVAVNPDLEKAGLEQKAITMVENVKNADPESLAVNYCLASLYLKTSNKEKGLENINAYIKKSSDKGDEPNARVLALKTKIENL
ncbi:thioredoxin family protein [Flavobacterium johnsoniae]|uniref:thioredoxin family protein n=1 Tax=Flavobacterium johnsoniae TaxID=986 RepID=UPI0025B143C9|nr:thioredoxin family protein [Flavobacterium johnsoniae]WJS93846.1 thioredoxin family protein [Flavobacterium johnsoniae]